MLFRSKTVKFPYCSLVNSLVKNGIVINAIDLVRKFETVYQKLDLKSSFVLIFFSSTLSTPLSGKRSSSVRDRYRQLLSYDLKFNNDSLTTDIRLLSYLTENQEHYLKTRNSYVSSYQLIVPARGILTPRYSTDASRNKPLSAQYYASIP